MKKQVVLGFALSLTACTALLLWLGPGAGSSKVEQGPKQAAVGERILANGWAPAARRVGPHQSSNAKEEAQAQAEGPTGLFDAESEALLRTYDELTDLLEASPEDCDALVYGFSTILGARGPRVRGFMAAPSAAPGDAQQAARVAATAKRIEHFSVALKKAMQACRAELSPEIKKLTEAAPRADGTAPI